MMFSDINKNKNHLYYYTYVSGDLEIPYLVEIQANSYNWVLNKGIEEVFNNSVPIICNSGKIEISYISLHLEKSKKIIWNVKIKI